MNFRRFTVGVLPVLLLGCADFERGDRVDEAADGGGADGGGAAPFASIHPILLARCRTCHDATGVAANTGFVLDGEIARDFDAAVRFVDTARPNESPLVRKANGESHAGGAPIPAGSDEHAQLLHWITRGAQP